MTRFSTFSAIFTPETGNHNSISGTDILTKNESKVNENYTNCTRKTNIFCNTSYIHRTETSSVENTH
ncbi:hypothetical protein HanIR_Chr16g0791091 [Helianthus annuus]|nr:hypothetical protein HanIR_Chr16g0791091 [Helianthus annuus]